MLSLQELFMYKLTSKLEAGKTYQFTDGSKVEYIGTHMIHSAWQSWTRYEFKTETGCPIHLDRNRVHAYIREIEQ